MASSGLINADIVTTNTSLPQLLYPSEQVKKHEGPAAQSMGISLYDLMERAGASAFSLLREIKSAPARLLILVGSGNNGGDGLVVARLAQEQGYDVTCCCAHPDGPQTRDSQTALGLFQMNGGSLSDWQQVDFDDFDLIVDSLLGTGISGPLKSPYNQLVEGVNCARADCLSIDVPSGLDADCGGVTTHAINASHTITFVAVKPGLVTGKGKATCGQLRFDDLGIQGAFAAQASASAHLIHSSNLSPLPKRYANSHKGNHGRLLCIGGNLGMAGAIRLCAEAALYSGAGLVKVVTHRQHQQRLNVGRPELMVSDTKALEMAMPWATVIAIGPGLGRDAWSHQLLSRTLEHCVQTGKPVVLDADALYWLGTDKDLKTPDTMVITPHSAEAARLLNWRVADVEEDRYAAVAALQNKYTCVAVLKGPGSLVRDSENTWVIGQGNPGMAAAGMGDVLTGCIAGLLAQYAGNPSDTVVRATTYHSAAADQLARDCGERGILASELFTYIRERVNA